MGIRVLLADDHTIIREGLRIVLETEADIRVTGEAADGRQAVRLAAELRPDVAVLDVAMSQLNGIEAAAQILAAGSGTRVLMLSMHATPDFAVRALRAGARGYLLKEAAGDEVVRAVRAVHAGEQYLSPAIAEKLADLNLPQGSAADPFDRLSAREREVLQLVVEGKSSADIARLLALSPKTVETYRSRIMQKLGLKDVPALVRFAVRRGTTSTE